MFEIIGLMFATALLFLLSGLAGGFFALVAWLLLRRRDGPKKRWIIFAASIPPASAAYLLACALGFALFVSGATDRLFGDFKEPLPNGYTFTGLAKMPDFAYIDSAVPGVQQPQLLGGIARIDVDGPLVFGQYSHKEDSFSEPVDGNIKYFIFDTRIAKLQNLKVLPSASVYSGHPYQLVESQSFRSREPSQILRRRIEDTVYFGPPILATAFYFLFLIRIRFLKTSSPT